MLMVLLLYACRAWVNFNGTGTVAIKLVEMLVVLLIMEQEIIQLILVLQY